MPFYTEKQTEAYLQEERRTLILPDETIQDVTARNLTWQSFDMMVDAGAISHDEFLGYVLQWRAEEPQHSFNDCFSNLVAFAFQSFRKPL